MDNWGGGGGGGGGGGLGSSLIFYFVAINDDRKSDIQHSTPASKKLFNANRFLFSYNYLKGKLL